MNTFTGKSGCKQFNKINPEMRTYTSFVETNELYFSSSYVMRDKCYELFKRSCFRVNKTNETLQLAFVLIGNRVQILLNLSIKSSANS